MTKHHSNHPNAAIAPTTRRYSRPSRIVHHSSSRNQGDKFIGILSTLIFVLFLCLTLVLHSSLSSSSSFSFSSDKGGNLDAILRQEVMVEKLYYNRKRERRNKDRDFYKSLENRRRHRRREDYEKEEKEREERTRIKTTTTTTTTNTARVKDENYIQSLYDHVHEIRKPKHPVIKDAFQDLVYYDVNNCPDHPPTHYPIEWPILDLIDNWNPSNISSSFRPAIYQGICRFDFKTEFHKALNYREAELPFILRDDPQVLEVVKRWNQPGYLSHILGNYVEYRTEYSETNSLMFYREQKNIMRPQGWEPPMSNVKMTYNEWMAKASQSEEDMGPDKPHWYFRVNAKGGTDHFMFRELPFFLPEKNFYIVDPSDTRGINCRFGMMGNTAATHFDGSRNFIMLFGGERRYILSHPKNCESLALYSRKHPSGRHSAVDWSHPDLEQFPEFQNAMGNEVVLQAGDVLYLPTHWFHFIVSLDLNWQCNARSGITDHYEDHILRCGF